MPVNNPDCNQGGSPSKPKCACRLQEGPLSRTEKHRRKGKKEKHCHNKIKKPKQPQNPSGITPCSTVSLPDVDLPNVNESPTFPKNTHIQFFAILSEFPRWNYRLLYVQTCGRATLPEILPSLTQLPGNFVSLADRIFQG